MFTWSCHWRCQLQGFRTGLGNRKKTPACCICRRRGLRSICPLGYHRAPCTRLPSWVRSESCEDRNLLRRNIEIISYSAASVKDRSGYRPGRGRSLTLLIVRDISEHRKGHAPRCSKVYPANACTSIRYWSSACMPEILFSECDW